MALFWSSKGSPKGIISHSERIATVSQYMYFILNHRWSLLHPIKNRTYVQNADFFSPLFSLQQRFVWSKPAHHDMRFNGLVLVM
ncbi:hypothetical protein RRG08_037249 [Elysia crispata]|uniref:Uncharacterized protein n=1 Tax=Elysia crispata TaxID=231223 RepID=A0AAE1D0Z0_9GAST|nr:hypothetical protein RRG08_037249 [Elysia crispata]